MVSTHTLTIDVRVAQRLVLVKLRTAVFVLTCCRLDRELVIVSCLVLLQGLQAWRARNIRQQVDLFVFSSHHVAVKAASTS